MADLDWTDLPLLFPGNAGAERWLPALRQHARVVEEWSPRVRVSAVGAEEAVRRQYAESLELWRIVEEAGGGEMLVDVGSGGGFPGIVIAALRPGVEVHLVEPLKKRARFRDAAVVALRLPNVTVHAVRAEEAGRSMLRDAAAVVTARAVAELRELLEYTAPLAAPGGLIALPKGSSTREEIAGARDAVKALNCKLAGIERMRPEVSETISVVLVRKVGTTPAQLPRRAGVPAKRPL